MEVNMKLNIPGYDTAGFFRPAGRSGIFLREVV
jgi:hypothetical protein